ncbi:MFS transporter [soil metagenome]
MPTIDPPSGQPRIPATVWVLGFVSMLMDISSEIIHALLPVFMVTVLAVSATTVGVIEGIAEATALIVKVFSGVISDYFGRRKLLVVIGYGMAALSKPLFPLAASVGWVFFARFVDRIGKGIRGAPRDALIADVSPPEIRGAAFGLRQSLDTVGAFVGPLLALGLMLLWANDFRAVFWVAVIPAFLALALLIFGVREPERVAPESGPASAVARANRRAFPISRSALRQLGPDYWWVVGVGAALTLARFSEAFLVLRALQGGLALALTPLVLVLMNLVYAACAYPFGLMADKVNKRTLLTLGILPLIAADLLLAQGGSLPWLGAGLICWGLHMAATQGLLAALVADSAPPELRGTAYGFFNLASGVGMLIASTVAGVLWDQAGAQATFYAGAVFAAASLLLLLLRGTWSVRSA